VSETPTLVYLEADDEITTVVRRVRAAEPGRVIVVAPGRSRATSSTVALRLLSRVGTDEGREIVVVGDGLTRSLAAEAGLPSYGSVDDARQARPSDLAVAEPRHAAIHVVRGAASDETAPTMPVSAGVSPAPDAASAAAGVSDETRPRPVVPRPAARPRAPARRRPIGLAVVLGVAAALLVAAVVAGATLLPAATITIVPSTVPVTATYEITVDDPERRGGTVEANATVTATGGYEVSERAAGTVVLFNWTFFPVDVPAGTFVAAGRQAFETRADVTVERGRLTPQGTIAAGEQAVDVIAAAPGPEANVGERQINVVVDQDVDARLGGVPENPEPRVLNPEPTAGGVAETGVEITEADVESAVDALRSELRRLAGAEGPEDESLIVLEPPAAEPLIDVPEGLAGTRDEPEVEISGSLAWELVVVDPADAEREAAGRLASDPAVPAGYDLLPEATAVSLGETRLDGDDVVVPATVSGRAAPQIESETILARVSGLTAEEARLALADLGEAEVELWPAWVETVPELEWRVDVRIEAPAP